MQFPSPSSDVRTLLHEKLDALLDDCDLVMDNAPLGQILNNLDDFLFVEGRNLIKEVLEQKLQERIDKIETAPEGKQCPHCKKKRQSNSKNRKPSSHPTDTSR